METQDDTVTYFTLQKDGWEHGIHVKITTGLVQTTAYERNRVIWGWENLN